MPHDDAVVVRSLSMVERWVYQAIPVMPEVTTAGGLAAKLPHLSRSTIDRVLRNLRSKVMVYEGSQGRAYSRYVEGSLL